MKRLSESKVLELIRSTKGNVSAVARAFGTARSSVFNFIQKREPLAQALTDAREELVDNAESALAVAVAEREGWAVCFTLKCLGKSRGYIEREPEPPPLEYLLGLLPTELANALRGEIARQVSAGRIGTGSEQVGPAPGPASDHPRPGLPDAGSGPDAGPVAGADDRERGPTDSSVVYPTSGEVKNGSDAGSGPLLD